MEILVTGLDVLARMDELSLILEEYIKDRNDNEDLKNYISMATNSASYIISNRNNYYNKKIDIVEGEIIRLKHELEKADLWKYSEKMVITLQKLYDDMDNRYKMTEREYDEKMEEYHKIIKECKESLLSVKLNIISYL